MSPVLLASSSGCLFGGFIVAARIGLGRQTSAALGAFGLVAVAFAVALVATALAPGGTAVTLADAWPLVLAGALVPGVSHILFVRAIQAAGPSRASVVVGTSPLISVLLALLALGEPLTAPALAGALLIVGGGAALGWERRRPPGFRAAGLAFGAGVALLFGVRDNLVRLSTGGAHLGPAPATAITMAAALVVVCAYLRLAGPRRSAADLSLAVRAFLPAGVLFGLGYLALVAAFDAGRVAIVSPLNATQSLWAIALSALLLRRTERVGPRMVLAGVLVVLGAAAIGLTR